MSAFANRSVFLQSQSGKGITNGRHNFFLHRIRVASRVLIETGDPDTGGSDEVAVGDHILIRGRSGNNGTILKPLVIAGSSTKVGEFSNQGGRTSCADALRKIERKRGVLNHLERMHGGGNHVT